MSERNESDDLLEKNKEIIDKFRAKFDGDIAIWPAPKGFEGVIVAAAPENSKIYENLVNKLNNPKGSDTSFELIQFATACVVHPDRETVKAIFKKKPGLALKIANRCQELAGVEIEELGKD